MGLLDGGLLGGGIAKEIGQTREAAGSKADSYRKPLGVTSFDSFGTSTMVQGEPSELARIRSPAGIERRWGYGSAEQEANQGYAYGHFYNGGDGTADSEEQIHGILSLDWANSTGRETQVSTEVDSQDMSTTDRYNRDAQPPVPEAQDKNKAVQDEFLVVNFTPTTDPADIVNAYEIVGDFSTARLPTTEYDTA